MIPDARLRCGGIFAIITGIYSTPRRRASFSLVLPSFKSPVSASSTGKFALISQPFVSKSWPSVSYALGVPSALIPRLSSEYFGIFLHLIEYHPKHQKVIMLKLK